MGAVAALQGVVRKALLARTGGLDLTRLDKLPASLAWTLRREELAPSARMARTRETGPVTKVTNLLGLEIWVVGGDPEVREVLGAPKDTYSNDIRPYLGTGKLAEQGVGGLGFTDPPEHTRLRKLLTPEFTMRRLARLEPMIEQMTREQLDEIAVAGRDGDAVDLVDLFAEPIPFRVICDLLGLSPERRAYFASVATARFDVTAGGVGAFEAATEALDFLEEEVRRQRCNPGPGLIGQILRDHGDEVSDVELAGLADGVFTGGMETSTSMLALGSAVLLADRDLWHRIVAEPDIVGPVVEELLRLVTPVQFAFPRFARENIDVAGQTIPKGAVLVCQLTAANRDPRTSPGGSMDLERASGSHLAFGYGFHRCVGAELGRMELRLALPALASRFPDMRAVTSMANLDYRTTSIVYGVERVPVLTGQPASH